MMENDSDFKLAQATANGDRLAAEVMVERLLDRVRCMCRHIAGNTSGDSQWEDMAQIIMIEILKSADTFRGDSTLEKWAITIAARTIWRMIKAQKRYYKFIKIFKHGWEQEQNEKSILNGSSSAMELSADRKLIRERMESYLRRINPDQKTAIVMKFVFGFSVTEISMALGVSENTVKDRLKHGKAKLKKLMQNDNILIEYMGRKKENTNE